MRLLQLLQEGITSPMCLLEGWGNQLRGDWDVGGSGRWTKMDIPQFTCEHAYGLVNKVERFFHIYIYTHFKRETGVVVMEGRALSWFKWWEFCTRNPAWIMLQDITIQRFQPSTIQIPYEILLGMKQGGTIQDYQK